MEKIRQFINILTIAISNCSLYSNDHELVDEYAKKVMSLIQEVMEDTLEIMVIEGDLIVNKIPLRDAGLHGVKLLRRMQRKGITRIAFSQGVTLSEVREFIVDMSRFDSPPKTYHHIRTGTVDIHLDERKTREMGVDLDYITHEQIQKVKEIYYGISPFKRLQIAGLEEIVSSFILAFHREANILKLLTPVRSQDEYIYTHATNVAVLSMFQAESLGIKGKLLHDIGISALLHDVGKLVISREMLNRPTPAYTEEATKMKQHPIYGAVYLSKIEGLTRLAPIVAFEHHMRYDGTGYPRYSSGKRGQHPCSQMVAIADFFDTLRSIRLYQRKWEIKDILAVMKMNAGRDFNPSLVDNFARTLLLATSG
jgi:HD-GYP domain-containing protein (c-di-GMP phosphodiesterase class II)